MTAILLWRGWLDWPDLIDALIAISALATALCAAYLSWTWRR